MRWLLFKIISLLAVFICMQGAVLPWVISNDYLPLWADIILSWAILMGWLLILDYLWKQAVKILRRRNESARGY